MSDFVSKEVCKITHEQLNETIDRLCKNIDRAVFVSIQTSKEVYLLCSKVKEQDKLKDKVDIIDNEVLKQKTLWKLFGIIGTVIVIGGGIVFGILRLV